MARHVRISTIGAAPPPSTPSCTPPQQIEGIIAFWKEKLNQIWPDQPDLVVVPEMCDRYADFTPAQMNDFSRTLGEQLLEYFREQARRHECYLTYPALRCFDDGTWRNSLQMIDRRGEIMGAYDKNHVVVSETTESGVLCGGEAPLFECDFGRVACAICFDLNFDELRLKYKAAQPDLILFSSMYHGGLMQAYWAYSCRAHFVAAVAGSPSAMISPLGQTIASTTNYTDHVTATVNLDCRLAHLDFNAEKLKALKAKYGLQVTIEDPGYLETV